MDFVKIRPLRETQLLRDPGRDRLANEGVPGPGISL